MSKYPELKYRQVLQLMQDFGVKIVRMKGSRHACISRQGHNLPSTYTQVNLPGPFW